MSAHRGTVSGPFFQIGERGRTLFVNPAFERDHRGPAHIACMTEIPCAHAVDTYLPLRDGDLKPTGSAGVKGRVRGRPDSAGKRDEGQWRDHALQSGAGREMPRRSSVPISVRSGRRGLILSESSPSWSVSFFPVPSSHRIRIPPSSTLLRSKGNRAISGRDLKLLMFTRANPWYEVFPGVDVRRFDPFRVSIRCRTDSDAIQGSSGYFEAVVDTVVDRYRPGFVRIRIRIEEGEPVVVSNVRLAFLPADAGRDSVRLMDALVTRPGRPLTRSGRESDLRKIAEMLENDGHAFAQVAADVAVRNKRADVTYRVSPGPKCRFGQIRIVGKPNGFRRSDSAGPDLQDWRRLQEEGSLEQPAPTLSVGGVPGRFACHSRHGCPRESGERGHCREGTAGAEPEAGGGV